jgi:hypothetical protein
VIEEMQKQKDWQLRQEEERVLRERTTIKREFIEETR